MTGPDTSGAEIARTALDVFADDLFAGRTAVVTGGGRGIGRCIALAFARYGADVIIAGRGEDNLARTRADIEALGRRCLAVPTNIRDLASVDAFAERAAGFGTIDFLVNNAGGQFPVRPDDLSDNGWRAVVDLNLNGTWNVISRFAPAMLERGSGAIVNMVHVYSLERGAPPFVHSGAARAGVVNMTQTLSYYYARSGVTVNALAPGSVSTAGLREEEFAHADDPEYEAATLQDIPAHRLAEPEEVAAITLFLCSPAARYVNGATIVADGAQSFGNWTPMLDPEPRS